MDVKLLVELFMVFFELGCLIVGGGYTMVQLIKYEIVIKRRWLDEKEFLDTIAIAESAPVPLL